MDQARQRPAAPRWAVIIGILIFCALATLPISTGPEDLPVGMVVYGFLPSILALLVKGDSNRRYIPAAIALAAVLYFAYVGAGLAPPYS